VVEEIEAFERELRTALFLTGSRDLRALRRR
jgi:isopentenyl diphosphate isomerase/L-lactate dehydrogenase-like FMN-dependent dehydrogenase